MFNIFSKDENVARTLRRIYVIDGWIHDLSELWQKLTDSCHSEYEEKKYDLSKVIRLFYREKVSLRCQCMPQEFQQQFLSLEIPLSFVELKPNVYLLFTSKMIELWPYGSSHQDLGDSLRLFHSSKRNIFIHFSIFIFLHLLIVLLLWPISRYRLWRTADQ